MKCGKMGLIEYYSVYVARGGDIMVILSSRVLGIRGTGRFSYKMRVLELYLVAEDLESGEGEL